MTEKRTVSLSDLPELRERLTGGTIEHEPTKAEYLYTMAEQILDDDSAVTQKRIRGGLARISKYSCESNDVGSKYYARLARYESKGDSDVSDTFILFDETSDVNSISTQSPKGIEFKQYPDGSIVLFMNRGTQPIEPTDPAYGKYLEVAETIIAEISDRHTAQQAEIEAEKEAKKHRIRKGLGGAVTSPYRFFTNPERRYAHYTTKGSYRRAWVAWPLVIAGVAYSHMPYVIDDNPDAKMGNFPMPLPVEALVDWNNIPDHKATGFDKPVGAVDIQFGQPIDSIPVITDYKLDNTPDASYIDGFGDTSGPNGPYRGEISKPGLWESDFDASYRPEKGWDRRDAQFVDNCYTIEGDFTPGRTSIMSQTPGINDMITLDIKDLSTMEVCKKNPNDEASEGSIFVYQAEDEA